ncbi:uncharacterized protein LOC111069487 [Drosophila obscura]|uniref:uncharacterized protein LOC111069487 n=1 Tax=Drosophila obscura TaxID=7282 RepID=UPI000BA088F9|nr:uncharacterized protein LOC111069487 [Drosophila obscura]
MRSPAVLLLFIGLSQAEHKATDKGPHTNCTLEELPVCGYKPYSGGRTVCTFLNMCFFDEFLLATNKDWRLESNEPCQWPTRDCYRIMEEIVTKTPKITTRKMKKHHKQGAHKNATKFHSRGQKRHRTTVQDTLKMQSTRRTTEETSTRRQLVEVTEEPKVTKDASWHLNLRNRKHFLTEPPMTVIRDGRQSHTRGKTHHRTESHPRGNNHAKKREQHDVRETLFE